MINWDDIRHFVAVAQSGSLRAGADQLGVKHSTVLRRIAKLEDDLGVLLFDRLPSGYRLTDAGAEALELAAEMVSASNRLQIRVLGRDKTMRGPLRVTMTPMLATCLLMSDLADFVRLYPSVELELISLDQPVNLTNREADVALRVVGDRSTLPLNLHALKGPEVFGGIYLLKKLLADWRAGPRLPLRWILKDFDGMPDSARSGEIPIDAISFKTAEAGAHIEAA